MNRHRPILRLLLAAGLAVLLAGCGFQLRGTAAGSASGFDRPVAIAGLPAYGPMERALREALDAAGATTVEGQEADALVLRISDRRSQRQVLSVDRRNKAVEFELEEALRFSVHTPAGEEVLPPRNLRTLRILFNPEVEVLGRNREEELLREDMRRELAQRVVERMRSELP